MARRNTRVMTPRNFRKLRKKLGKRCAYCFQLVRPGQATRDHVVPRARGGSEAEDNLTMACLRCNQRKGSMDADQFRMMVAWERVLRKSRIGKGGIILPPLRVSEGVVDRLRGAWPKGDVRA